MCERRKVTLTSVDTLAVWSCLIGALLLAAACARSKPPEHAASNPDYDYEYAEPTPESAGDGHEPETFDSAEGSSASEMTASGNGNATAGEQPAAAAPPQVQPEDLDRFAYVYKDAARIQVEYQQRAATAKTQGELQDLQDQMNQRLTEAVEQRGMTVQEFRDINQAINQDPELRAEFEDRLQNVQ